MTASWSVVVKQTFFLEGRGIALGCNLQEELGVDDHGGTPIANGDYVEDVDGDEITFSGRIEINLLHRGSGLDCVMDIILLGAEKDSVRPGFVVRPANDCK